jgi:F0F1-type ATP synthase beta subunit
MISAMTSPMSVSPHIKTPHIKTPLSLLANTPAALTIMDKIDPLISSSDALDMKDLHSRVYFLQSRITSTLQQTKVAREKTRTILLLRRAEVSCLCFRVCVREGEKRDEGRSLSIS